MITVAVLGGGPAGAVAAIALATAGIDVSVFDSAVGPVAKIGETVPPSVRPLAERLGLLDVLNSPSHRTGYGHRSYWGRNEAVEEHFFFGTAGAGWHVDREQFEQALATAATDAGANWHWDHHAVEAKWNPARKSGWNLELEAPASPKHVTADIIVDATGRRARFARGYGAEQVQYDNLVGVAAVLDDGPGNATTLDGFTVVEAVPNGWWYSAPLSSNRVAVVFMTDGDLLDVDLARDPHRWLAALDLAPRTRERIAPWLADGIDTLRTRTLRAASVALASPTGAGWLAVGDAAAAFDPLSSHGIGSAITTGYYGACAVADRLAGNTEAFGAYGGLVTSLFDDYLELLHEHYLDEQRWPTSTFWRRRHVSPKS